MNVIRVRLPVSSVEYSYKGSNQEYVVNMQTTYLLEIYLEPLIVADYIIMCVGPALRHSQLAACRYVYDAGKHSAMPGLVCVI